MSVLRSCCIAGLSVVAATAQSQQFPAKAIRFVVPYPPGGGTDQIARLLGQKMSDAWGQQVIVENRPGAQGNIGQALVAKARPDGYTIVLGATAALCINPVIYSNVGFDALKDFAPIVLVTRQPYFIVVHPSVPARTIKDLIALAKANPKGLNFGTSGGFPQLGGELFKSMAGIDMVHIPYAGAAPALFALIAGQLELTITTPSGPLPFVRSGRVRLLAVTSPARIDIVPGVPTVSEAGLPGYEMLGWYGVLAPAGTPREIVARFNAEINRGLRAPDIKDRLAQQAVQTAGGSPVEFAEYLGKEYAKWTRVAMASSMKVD